MHQDDPKDPSQEPQKTPDLDDVAPGSDADATPVKPVGETPPDPNARQERAKAKTEACARKRRRHQVYQCIGG